MFWILLAALGWAACGVPAYLLTRAYWRRRGWGWTRGDRRTGLAWFPIGGPVALLTALILRAVGSWFSDDREASW